MTIRMEPRLLCVMLHIDTNLVNARQKLDAVNRLEVQRASKRQVGRPIFSSAQAV